MGAQGEGLGTALGQGVWQDVKGKNTGFGNARLGERDQRQEAKTWKHERLLSVRFTGLQGRTHALSKGNRPLRQPQAIWHKHLSREQRRFLLLLTYAVITKAAMRGTRGPENLAGETIFKFHSLAIDDDFFGSGRRAVPP